MIPEVISPTITAIKNSDSRLAISDKAELREITALNAIKEKGSTQNLDNRESVLAFVTANPDADLPETADVEAQLRKRWLKRAAINDARQELKQKLAKAKHDRATEILKSPEVQKAHADLMARIAPPLAEIAHAYVALFGMSSECRDRGTGFRYGICETMPLDLFGAPNAWSPLAQYLQAAVEAGFVKASALPKELRGS